MIKDIYLSNTIKTLYSIIDHLSNDKLKSIDLYLNNKIVAYMYLKTTTELDWSEYVLNDSYNIIINGYNGYKKPEEVRDYLKNELSNQNKYYN